MSRLLFGKKLAAATVIALAASVASQQARADDGDYFCVAECEDESEGVGFSTLGYIEDHVLSYALDCGDGFPNTIWDACDCWAEDVNQDLVENFYLNWADRCSDLFESLSQLDQDAYEATWDSNCASLMDPDGQVPVELTVENSEDLVYDSYCIIEDPDCLEHLDINGEIIDPDLVPDTCWDNACVYGAMVDPVSPGVCVAPDYDLDRFHTIYGGSMASQARHVQRYSSALQIPGAELNPSAGFIPKQVGDWLVELARRPDFGTGAMTDLDAMSSGPTFLADVVSFHSTDYQVSEAARSMTPLEYTTQAELDTARLQAELDKIRAVRLAWHENGPMVTSCDEYAYEKFYRYSLFEDFSAQLGGDYVGILQVAYGVHPELDLEGYAKLWEEQLYDTFEEILESENDIYFAEAAKPAFKAVANTIARTPQYDLGILDTKPKYDSAMHDFEGELACCDSGTDPGPPCDISCDALDFWQLAPDVYLDDPDLLQDVVDAKHTSVHDWEWHRQMYCRVLGDPNTDICSPDELLADAPVELSDFKAYDRVKRDFAKALEFRQHVIDYIHLTKAYQIDEAGIGDAWNNSELAGVIADKLATVDPLLDASIDNQVAAALAEHYGGLDSYELSKALWYYNFRPLGLDETQDLVADLNLEWSTDAQVIVPEAGVFAEVVTLDETGLKRKYMRDLDTGNTIESTIDPLAGTATNETVTSRKYLDSRVEPDGTLYEAFVEPSGMLYHYTGDEAHLNFLEVAQHGAISYSWITRWRDETAGLYKRYRLIGSRVKEYVYDLARSRYIYIGYLRRPATVFSERGQDFDRTVTMSPTGVLTDRNQNLVTGVINERRVDPVAGALSDRNYIIDPSTGNQVLLPTPGELRASLFDAVSGQTTEYVRDEIGGVLVRTISSTGVITERPLDPSGQVVLAEYDASGGFVRDVIVDPFGDLFERTPIPGGGLESTLINGGTVDVMGWNAGYSREFEITDHGVWDRITVRGQPIRERFIEGLDAAVIARRQDSDGFADELVMNGIGEMFWRDADLDESGLVREIHQDGLGRYFGYNALSGQIEGVEIGADRLFLATVLLTDGTAEGVFVDDQGGFGREVGGGTIIEIDKDILGTATIPLDQYDWDGLEAILRAANRSIQRIVAQAGQMGCFDPYTPDDPDDPMTVGYAMCAWSPQVFIDSLNDSVERKRESAHNDCITATKGYPFFDSLCADSDGIDDEYTETVRCLPPIDEVKDDVPFACGKYIHDMYATQVRCRTDDPWGEYYTQNSWAFDDFIAHRNKVCDDLREKISQKAEELNDDGQSNSSKENDGGKLLSLDFEYDFTYGVDPLDDLIYGREKIATYDEYGNVDGLQKTKLEAHAGGYFAVVLGLLKKYEFNLVEANADATLTDNESKCVATISFAVLENEVYSGGYSCGDGFADEGKDIDREFVRAKTHFQVGPVPMSITAGAVGKMGLQTGAQLDYNVEPLTFPDSDPGEYADLTPDQIIDANLTAGMMVNPHAGLEVFVRLAVDLVVASIGVEGALTVIDVGLPFEMAFAMNGELYHSWHPTENCPSLFINFDANFDTNLDAVLRTLDGKVSLFVEFLGKAHKKKLFGWKGFENEWNLLHNRVPIAELEVDIPLMEKTEQ